MTEKLQQYILENLETDKIIKFNKFRYAKENASCTIFMEDTKNVKDIDRTYLDEAFDDNYNDELILGKTSNIDDYISNSQTDNKFQKILFKFIDDRNLKDSDVYNKVHIDRRLFSKIRSDNNYHPSKDTVILLGLALELNEKEFLELLESASYSLPKNNEYDLIIRFCFIEGIYSLSEVNNLLDSYNCKMFSY